MDTNLKIESWKVDPTSQKISELNLNAEISDSVEINGKTVGGDTKPSNVRYVYAADGGDLNPAILTNSSIASGVTEVWDNEKQIDNWSHGDDSITIDKSSFTYTGIYLTKQIFPITKQIFPSGGDAPLGINP